MKMKSKIIEYKLATGYSNSEIVEDVAYLLSEGFQPFGSISVTNLIAPNESHIHYAQPMVKYSLKPLPNDATTD